MKKMKRIRTICLVLLTVAVLLAACGGFSFSITTMGDKTTIDVNSKKDGEFMESDPLEIGRGRTTVVESSLEKGELQIEFLEASVFFNDDGPDDFIAGDVVDSVTVGPGSQEKLNLESGNYVLHITTIGETKGSVEIRFEKEE